MAIIANAYAWLQELQLFAISLHSVAIFVKYREVPTRTILPNPIGHCRETVERQRCFMFWRRRRQKREKEEVYTACTSSGVSPPPGWQCGTQAISLIFSQVHHPA